MDRQSTGRSPYDGNIVEHQALDYQAMAGTSLPSGNTALLDSCLIAQIGQHDQQALQALYDRYGAQIYTIALRITQDRGLAETVVLDVFYAIWQSANSFQIGQSVSLWLIELAQRQAVDALHSHSQPSSSLDNA